MIRPQLAVSSLDLYLLYFLTVSLPTARPEAVRATLTAQRGMVYERP